MPGTVVHAGALVTCTHFAPATPDAPVPRVAVGGLAVVAIHTPYTIAGCGNPASSGGPCSKGEWTSGAGRVRVGGAPVAISTGASKCPPAGALVPKAVQSRVVAE